MDETPVPAHPVVDIRVSAEAVTVDGEVVDRGSAGGPDAKVAMLLGVHAAARRVAQPLGRPVRAKLVCGDEEKHLVVHPDGSVTDVEDTFPVVSLIAPPGARATPISWAARKKRRFRLPPIQRTRLAVGAAYVALGVVLVAGFVVGVTSGGAPPPVAEGALEAPGSGHSADEVVLGARLDRLPGVSDVVAQGGLGQFLLKVTTGRAAQLRVVAEPAGGKGETRLWRISTSDADTRTLAFDGLEPGTYRWSVIADGERPRTGNVLVRPSPPPVVVAADTSDPTPTSPPADGSDNGGDSSGGSDGKKKNGGGDDGGRGDSDLPGPTAPVDPDDPSLS